MSISVSSKAAFLAPFVAGFVLASLAFLPFLFGEAASKNSGTRFWRPSYTVAKVKDSAGGSASSGEDSVASKTGTAAQSGSADSVALGSHFSFLYDHHGKQLHEALKGVDPARLAPLTAWAQEYIWKHQHPTDCDSAEFIVSRGHVKGNGIGSILHVSGYHLAVAMERGKVFMWHESAGEEWTDAATCGDKRNWECHFKAPTHCRRDKHLKKSLTGNPSNYQEVELHHTILGMPSNQIPSVFRDRLLKEFPEMPEEAQKYWWRGQSIAYLMRLNSQALETIREMRKQSSMFRVFPDNKTLSAEIAAQTPWPHGIIHAHVRHGDKFTEMELQGTTKYLNASYLLHATHPLGLRRILFVSTEDSKVLEEAMSSIRPGWTLLFSDIKRANVGPLAQVMALGKDSAAMTTRTHLLQMLMSLEADAWIGTRGSNWNRLLDELRCIWTDKCTHPYVEVGTDKSWKNYDW